MTPSNTPHRLAREATAAELADEAHKRISFSGFDDMLHAIIDRLASLALEEQQRWRPISSAPKDGTAILLGARGGSWIGYWHPIYQSGYRPDNPWSSLMLNHDHMGEKWQKPTHWQPLPKSPTQEKPNE